jgi:hypothetical protein
MKRSLSILAAAALLVGLMASPVIAVTSGTWFQYPTGSTSYFAEVQQPINSANTSNWSAKSKGGIPIMYKLFSQSGPAVFESIYSDNTTHLDPNNHGTCWSGAGADHDNDCAFLGLVPSPGITFAQLTTLSTKYQFSLGNCHGGSLRWEVGIDMPSGPDGQLFIYYGDYPSFTDCTTTNQSDLNMIGQPDLRYDTTQFNGVFYNSYANTLALLGAGTVTYAEIVIDSGWGGDQRLTVSDTTVNDNVHQWNPGGSGTLTPTCNLPDAFIAVTKVDGVADGAINETTVYPQSADTSKQFRIIDCKYQYVLSIPSLNGAGTFDVEILIDGNPVDTSQTSPPGEVRFDLK